MASVLHLIGYDGLRFDDATLRPALKGSVALVASKRLYGGLREQFPKDHLPAMIPVVPLKKCIESIRESLERGDVTVLASGDPLFFGIGRKLGLSFPDHAIRIHPALSSMQLAFARFALPWDDATFVSLHGRSNTRLAARLLKNPKTFVFTDPQNSPDAIAAQLLAECGVESRTDVSVYVAEHLGLENERLFSGNLTETAAASFVEPNVMILLLSIPSTPPRPRFGLQEKEICHSRGLLTKNEVRAAAIHALRMPQTGVLWDVGAGSGSVGLEVARLFPDTHVLAIEKEEEQWQNIMVNRNTFAAWNLELVKGMAPLALQQLPDPARIFVGGSGGNLQQILEFCAEKLLPGGIVVVNAVIVKTARIAPEILYRCGFAVEIREIAVQRFSYPEEEKQKFNPIKIIVAVKPMLEPGDE